MLGFQTNHHHRRHSVAHSALDIPVACRLANSTQHTLTNPLTPLRTHKITGPGGSLKITTGSCSLTRSADPLKEEFALECKSPGVVFDAKVPRYTSRYACLGM